VPADAPSDPERLHSCVAAIAGRLCSAKSPAILVDADAARFGVASEVMVLAEKMQAPVAVTNAAKAVTDETFPHYLGIYIGKASEPHAREAIETSDCVLAIGYRPIEVTTGDFSALLPVSTIHARGHSVDVGDDNYQAVTLKEVLHGVIDAVPSVTNRTPAVAAAMARNPVGAKVVSTENRRDHDGQRGAGNRCRSSASAGGWFRRTTPRRSARATSRLTHYRAN
jgi:indolepyruvate decarboxylase